MAQISKWRRIATEGMTVADGRTVTRQELLECAENFRSDYKVRVNLEHIRGLGTESQFGALGDVRDVKAEEADVQIGGKTERRMCLYARIEPLPALVKMNSEGQKLSSSCEIANNFGGTGKSGLVGLAVTDSAAMFGTDALGLFSHRRRDDEDTFFTPGIEEDFVFIEDEGDGGAESGFLKSFSAFLDKFTGQAPTQQAGAPDAQPGAHPEGQQPPAPDAAAALFANGMKTLSEGLDKQFAAFGKRFDKIEAEQRAQRNQLENEPDPKRSFSQRPRATGGAGEAEFVY